MNKKIDEYDAHYNNNASTETEDKLTWKTNDEFPDCLYFTTTNRIPNKSAFIILYNNTTERPEDPKWVAVILGRRYKIYVEDEDNIEEVKEKCETLLTNRAAYVCKLMRTK